MQGGLGLAVHKGQEREVGHLKAELFGFQELKDKSKSTQWEAVKYLAQEPGFLSFFSHLLAIKSWQVTDPQGPPLLICKMGNNHYTRITGPLLLESLYNRDTT